jgi:DNA-binding MarR family transcriptional regulator
MAIQAKTLDALLEAARHWGAGPTDHNEAMWAASSVLRANSLIMGNMDRILKRHGITFARYQVIATLYYAEGGSLTLSRLGQLLLVHPTSVTSIIDKLEAADLVRRRAHPTDRRTTHAQLTTKGRALYGAVRPELDEDDYGIRGLTQGELVDLAMLIWKIRRACGDPVAEREAYLELVTAGEDLEQD